MSGPNWPLFDTAATRAIEAEAAAALPAHALMQRAGLAVARLTMALAPHAKRIWLACGPGNNGGDGLEAALHLHRLGKRVSVTWLGSPDTAPPDARAALQRATTAGVPFIATPPADHDFAIDALLGLGASRPLEGEALKWAHLLRDGSAPVLAIDLPSGLNGDTGQHAEVRATHTLSLLTLKPGLYTAGGRDAAGEVWFDDLGVQPKLSPTASLVGAPVPTTRPHDSHKGSWGDVAVVGGAAGMGGAALLAARAALCAGAGRVFVTLLDANAPAWDGEAPELMLRPLEQLDASSLHVACGCGGGATVAAALPRLLSTARSLVLDADALNALAGDPGLRALLQARARRQRPTVLTPHPLEAARLLACSTTQVQADRISAARTLAEQYGCVVVLKGSGSVIAAPDQAPRINPTGNARLATAGTGDVLAGCVAARLATGEAAMNAAASAVYLHGLAADHWPTHLPLTASGLARRMRA